MQVSNFSYSISITKIFYNESFSFAFELWSTNYHCDFVFHLFLHGLWAKLTILLLPHFSPVLLYNLSPDILFNLIFFCDFSTDI